MTVGRVTFLVFAFLWSPAFAQLPSHDADLLLDYSQWKFAAGDGRLLDPVSMTARPGFTVELLRVAEKGEGSWISLAFDTHGRLLVGREDKGILRFGFAGDGSTIRQIDSIDDTLLEPRGLLVAHGSLYVTANNSKGLYRLKSTADGNYAPPELLQRFEGGVGHGRNGLTLGPDDRIYMACGNNVTIPKEWDLAKSPYRHFDQGRLLPCAWNEFLFDSDVTPPCGFVASCDADGRNWQLVAGGFRNPYDLAFNRDGELFTYDADMEWDLGAPWYRPTTVVHVVPGGEYGWRQGTNVWPDHFPDALPRVVDVGLGSPTGVTFGERSKFPEPYRSALFVLDWAYGRILAVHLSPKGASYAGTVETFLRGKPVNVTDASFGPDGAMYFTVGGRGTRSAIYRVKWTGEVKEPEPKNTDEPADRLREIRRALETRAMLGEAGLISAGLDSTDPFVRSAAQVAWQTQSPDGVSPRTPLARRALLLAMLRNPQRAVPKDWWESLNYAQDAVGGDEHRLCLRVAQLALKRQQPTEEDKLAIRDSLEQRYPAASWAENQLLAELLVYLQSPHVVDRTLALIPKADSDQQRLFYLYVLRLAENGWTIDRRREYLRHLKASEKFAGAHYFPRFLTYIRTDALATFSDAELAQLAEVIDELGRYVDSDVAPPRPEIHKWSLDTLTHAVGTIRRPANLEQGAKMYSVAQCVRCHRHGELGTPFGPDLQHVTARFGTRELLEAIIEPSKVVDEKYRTVTLETSSGVTGSGYLVGGNAETFFLAQDPLRPASFQRIARNEVTNRTHSPVSPMPEGLLNGLTADEIYDLLGYLGLSEQKQQRDRGAGGRCD